MNDVAHYRIPRRSGRYPWGSGDRPYQGDKNYSESGGLTDRGSRKFIKKNSGPNAICLKNLTPKGVKELDKITNDYISDLISNPKRNAGSGVYYDKLRSLIYNASGDKNSDTNNVIVKSLLAGTVARWQRADFKSPQLERILKDLGINAGIDPITGGLLVKNNREPINANFIVFDTDSRKK